MTENWQDCFVADIASPAKNALVGGPFGSNLVSKDYVETGTPVIRGQNMGERWISGEFVFVNEEKTKQLSPNTARPGDLIFTQRGTLGQVAIVPEKLYDAFIISQSQMKLTVDKEKADTLFMYYVFKSPEQQDYILRNAIQTGVPHTNLEHLKTTPIFLPPLPEQRAIAAILGALDDKIELNRRMNRTLESMARAVFSRMMNDEGGRKKVGTVGEDFNLTMGQSPPGETYNEDGQGMPFFQGRADFGFRYPENRVYCTAPTRFAKAGDTLVSVRAPVGDVNMAKEECAIGRGVAAVRHKTGSRSYTYYAMKSLEENFGVFEAEGTVFGSINKADFQNLEIGIPTTEQVEDFEKTCYPIDQMIENNEKESRTLASLRDSLLPKLMRGEVRVKS